MLTRRDFLKLAAVGTAALALGIIDGQATTAMTHRCSEAVTSAGH